MSEAPTHEVRKRCIANEATTKSILKIAILMANIRGVRRLPVRNMWKQRRSGTFAQIEYQQINNICIYLRYVECEPCAVIGFVCIVSLQFFFFFFFCCFAHRRYDILLNKWLVYLEIPLRQPATRNEFVAIRNYHHRARARVVCLCHMMDACLHGRGRRSQMVWFCGCHFAQNRKQNKTEVQTWILLSWLEVRLRRRSSEMHIYSKPYFLGNDNSIRSNAFSWIVL